MIYQYRWADMTAMVRATAAINGIVSDRRHPIRSAQLGDLGMEPGGTVDTNRITPPRMRRVSTCLPSSGPVIDCYSLPIPFSNNDGLPRHAA
jgi:hypothetical protein